MAVKSYGPDTDFCYVHTMSSLALDIWPDDLVLRLRHVWVMDNIFRIHQIVKKLYGLDRMWTNRPTDRVIPIYMYPHIFYLRG